MPGGRSEWPNPGCDGTSTSACSASRAMSASDPCRPMCGCRNRIGRPLPRRTSSIFAPLMLSMSIHLDVRFANDASPARVFLLQQLLECRRLHRRRLGALFQKHSLNISLYEHPVDLAMEP